MNWRMLAPATLPPCRCAHAWLLTRGCTHVAALAWLLTRGSSRSSLACSRSTQVGGLYTNLLQLLDDETGGDGVESDTAAAAASGRMTASDARNMLPYSVRVVVYLTLLQCRFDRDEPAALIFDAPAVCHIARVALAPALGLCRAEHHAALVHSAARPPPAQPARPEPTARTGPTARPEPTCPP